jgi:MoaA/NifB/PqqE/SkfB family radical SAM enzyme
LIPKSNEVRIEIATTCNAECVFCPHPTEEFTRVKRIMSLEDYKFYLDKVLDTMGEQITDIGFSGFGEIFTDKHILDKLKFASTKGRDIHVLTNGSLFTKEILDEMFKLNIKDIRISIHTSNPDNYDNILKYKNNKTNYETVKNNIDYIIANKPESMDLILTAVIDDSTVDDVEQLIADYDSRCYLEIWKPHNWVYGKGYRNVDRVALKKTCGRPFHGPIEVLNNGDIIMCCFDFNANMVLGNLKEQTLEEIYSSDMFTKLLTTHTEGSCGTSDLICNGCDQLHVDEDIILHNNRISDKTNRLSKTSTNLNTII